ncbi:MAG: Lrp/AsnC ligand binding domain-containing protein, partial [Candidatus Dormibacteria bacterium]
PGWPGGAGHANATTGAVWDMVTGGCPVSGLELQRREAMVRAYILMTLDPGKAMDVVKRLRGEPGVLQVDAITGEYDAVAQIQADDVKGVGALVVDRIQSFSGVARTITCLAVE